MTSEQQEKWIKIDVSVADDWNRLQKRKYADQLLLLFCFHRLDGRCVCFKHRSYGTKSLVGDLLTALSLTIFWSGTAVPSNKLIGMRIVNDTANRYLPFVHVKFYESAIEHREISGAAKILFCPPNYRRSNFN